MWTEADRDHCFARVARAVAPMPETQSEAWGVHLRLTVRGKGFGYVMADHHGDGRLAVTCRAPLGVQQALVGADPGHFFVPAYTGRNGWIGVDLDPAVAPDWDEVDDLLRQAWTMTAPRVLQREFAAHG